MCYMYYQKCILLDFFKFSNTSANYPKLSEYNKAANNNCQLIFLKKCTRIG